MSQSDPKTTVLKMNLKAAKLANGIAGAMIADAIVERDEALTEVTRLRAALQRIADYNSASGWENHPAAVRAIAREALANGK